MRAHRLFALILAGAACAPAMALDFRSTAGPAILYDTPSAQGKRVFVVSAGSPLEVIVTLEKWVKVRDREGHLAWIERSALADGQTVVVTAERAVVHQQAATDAPKSFEASRGVILNVSGPATGTWLPVRHADGDRGFIRRVDVWGH
ncbi:SH3 domain-containing protein [Denitromonas iodatirespirans]|uniref:SH3 domain-containing protein n=1 Tax=Denitromonas iodatirespirans TaxID=2795389 RepID=A0A944DD24_DENI1|nr:SH3 domain-containing protein [Denitromonas iodatirespirans]MBT0960498.1 SH3 domain-containing protein [Denitromonas iodatirespirans]